MSGDQINPTTIAWPEILPQHVAIVMDGNGRWAQARSLPRHAGHKEGVHAVRAVTEACGRLGVKALTLFAFSSENWGRPESEVSLLMELFLLALQRETTRLARNNVRLRLIGDRARFPARLQEEIAAAEQRTAANDGLQLTVAASYGGRWDIAQAAAAAAREVLAGRLQPEQITPERLERFLSTADLPEPDLLIRTGGEQRISNFLLWQFAYTEFYFTDVLWPDFRAPELAAAFADYARRQRRIGRTPEQVEQLQRA
ncbi:MAG TPA: isoprenyl transferase [Gammaproteobacteria bacterium]|nr:isoprenyl transferase [Gammaproteobacteria bacterium]